MRTRRTRNRLGLALGLALGLGCVALVAVLALGGLGSGAKVETEPARGAADSETVARQVARSASRFKARRAKLQKRGKKSRIKPRPAGKHSRGDRGAIWDRGCMLLPPETRSKQCVFGKRKSRTTVVLFGDSHAMHFFGAFNRLAKRRGWRLVALTKAGCPPYRTVVYNNKVSGAYRQCVKWRRHSLRRIERKERPKLIFTAGAISYTAMRNGKRISSSKRNRATLRRGYKRTLERLVDSDSRVIALQDLPKAPHDMTDCVGANLKRLRKCAFRKPRNYGRTFEARAARSVDGVRKINLSPALCRKRRCFGVIRNTLVYRDNDHMTATFSRRAMAPWVARRLARGKR